MGDVGTTVICKEGEGANLTETRETDSAFRSYWCHWSFARASVSCAVARFETPAHMRNV